MPLTLGETLKPGETLTSRDTRFEVWGNRTGFNKPSSASSNRFATDFGLSILHDQDAARCSFEIAKSQRERNKGQVLKLKKVGSSATTLSETTHLDSFADHSTRVKRLLRTVDDFKETFDFFGLQSADGMSTKLPLTQVNRVVRTVLGAETPPYIIDKFSKLAYQVATSRFITWEEFRPICDQALQAMVADVETKASVPPLVLLLKKQPKDNGLGSAASLWTTNYQDNFDLKSATLAQSLAAASRPVTAPSGFSPIKTSELGLSVGVPEVSSPVAAHSPLATPHSHVRPTSTHINTTMAVPVRPSYFQVANKHLVVGTPKGTPCQLPGYEGHLPQNVRNRRKQEHSDGFNSRQIPKDNLILTDKGMGSLLGYSGHIPKTVQVELAFKERKTGCDPKCTTGATYGETRLML